ncbi:MgtC/SapB family protein [Methylobacterium nigriterrae]|uniref:MgtC/SapB family protein n=1 Tax=Methylobacterium nigriterrae TaxID=3127512 RepID=UPI0030138E35
MIGRLALAAVLGSIIGLERERLLWAAGLRTHMLVCVGACLFMLVSSFGFADVVAHDHVVLDPSRVAAQVVSGIGFLGAGTILLRGEVVRGLTTAASLWAVAAIGLASGGGLYVPALAATAIVFAILAGMKPIEERWRDRAQSRVLRVSAQAGCLTLDTVQEASGQPLSRIKQFVVQPGPQEGREDIRIAFARLPAGQLSEIAGRLRTRPGVESIEIEEG